MHGVHDMCVGVESITGLRRFRDGFYSAWVRGRTRGSSRPRRCCARTGQCGRWSSCRWPRSIDAGSTAARSNSRGRAVALRVLHRLREP